MGKNALVLSHVCLFVCLSKIFKNWGFKRTLFFQLPEEIHAPLIALRNSFSGLVVTPNQAEQLSRIFSSMSAILASSSRTGLAVPPPVEDAVRTSPVASVFDISNIEMASPPVSPVENPTASATPRRSKRQLSLHEVKEKMMTGLNEPLPLHTSKRQSDKELFNRIVEMAEVCLNLLKIEKL